MKKNKKVNKRFVEIYENKIKDLRREYYKNIINLSNSKDTKSLYLSFYLMPILVAIIILVIGKFSIVSEIIALIAIVIINIIIKILSNIYEVDSTNNYLKELIKHGYLSIEDYEAKLKKYVTGPDGYYNHLLQEIMSKYNISNNTRKIQGINGELYYIWTNSKQDSLLLLNSRYNEKPQIISIKFVNIRYYRVDNQNKQIVLKTDLNEYYFKLDALDTLNEFIKEKRYENLISFTPEDHINDFELYMHKIKSDLDIKERKCKEQFSITISKIIMYLIGIALIIFIKITLNKYVLIFNVINILLIILLSLNLKRIINKANDTVLNEEDYIKALNTDEENKRRFNELKFSLGIKDNYNRIYSSEGACYLTWVANGYFHIFLNLIYFNVVYMSVKTSDVLYYAKEGNECIVKLKDKTLTFNKEAEEIFSKILPNKDYNWIKGFHK